MALLLFCNPNISFHHVKDRATKMSLFITSLHESHLEPYVEIIQQPNSQELRFPPCFLFFARSL